jgi:hypothetical protein
MTDDAQRSLAADLAAQAGSVASGQDQASASERLAALEEEHGELSARRRKLHETIDLLSGLDALKPDVAAILASYRRSERDISWRRRVMYREIGELRAEALRSGHDTPVS